MRSTAFVTAAIALSVVVVPTRSAVAGMPSFSLHEAAGQRIDVISFFVLGLVVCSLVVRWAWNCLADAFPAMPRLLWKQAFCLMLLSTLVLYVVLTMVSGARELMTPGAWARSGVTYRLLPPERESALWLESARRQALAEVHRALVKQASEAGGKLPDSREESGIPAATWAGIHPSGSPLAYVPGLSLGVDVRRIVAYETNDYGPRRFFVRLDGTIEQAPASEISRQLLEEFSEAAARNQTVSGSRSDGDASALPEVDP